MKKHWRQLRGCKGFFQVTSARETKECTWRLETGAKQRPPRNTMFWLVPHGLVSLLSYTIQNHLHIGGTIPSELDPPKPIVRILRGRGRWISGFETSLVYKVSSRTARSIQRNPVLKEKHSSVCHTIKKTWLLSYTLYLFIYLFISCI